MPEAWLLESPLPIATPARPRILPGQVRGLRYSVRGQTLIDGIDLDLEASVFSVVMGPNGAGKSLLLKLLHGLIAPTSGQILWGGRPMSPAIRQRQGMVFQKPVLLRRSVAANLRFALKLRPRLSHREIPDILARVGLADKAHQPARLLSGGEQQRLTLARALVLEPEVVFLDEPTASLDPASTAALEQIVRQVHRAGTKVLFVTHDIGQARRLADEVIFLNHGRVTEQSPANEFFANPRSAPARDYLAGRLVLS